jgi:diaminohydroxyphosphoribosylaminopyrimidine deaminase/5-amino-6-(5-phosphoribosylamino)uracil reductase
VGVETILQDNPRLSVRFGLRKGRRFFPPLKIILDSRLRTPLKARVFSKASPGRVILVTTKASPAARRKALAAKAEILVLPQKGGRVDLKALFKALGRRGVVRLLIEGGGEVLSGAFSEGLVRELCFIIAPVILGGRRAVSSVGGDASFLLSTAPRLKNVRTEFLGKDILVRGTF